MNDIVLEQRYKINPFALCSLLMIPTCISNDQPLSKLQSRRAKKHPVAYAIVNMRVSKLSVVSRKVGLILLCLNIMIKKCITSCTDNDDCTSGQYCDYTIISCASVTSDCNSDCYSCSSENECKASSMDCDGANYISNGNTCAASPCSVNEDCATGQYCDPYYSCANVTSACNSACSSCSSENECKASSMDCDGANYISNGTHALQVLVQLMKIALQDSIATWQGGLYEMQRRALHRR